METKYALDDIVVVTVEHPAGCDNEYTLGDVGMITEVCNDDRTEYCKVHTGSSAFYYSAEKLRFATTDEMRSMIKKYIKSCRDF